MPARKVNHVTVLSGTLVPAVAIIAHNVSFQRSVISTVLVTLTTTIATGTSRVAASRKFLYVCFYVSVLVCSPRAHSDIIE